MGFGSAAQAPRFRTAARQRLWQEATACIRLVCYGPAAQSGILQKWVRNDTPCHLSRTEGNVFVIVYT